MLKKLHGTRLGIESGLFTPLIQGTTLGIITSITKYIVRTAETRGRLFGQRDIMIPCWMTTAFGGQLLLHIGGGPWVEIFR